MELHDPDDLASLPALLTVVRQRAGVDFRDHRRDILVKGVRRRVAATGAADLEAYHQILEREPGEIERLVEALVQPVSSFFRERDVFDALANAVLPEQRLRARGAAVRVWAAGVATGEEAWSLAMLLAVSRQVTPGQMLELLATDVDERSLAAARLGRYPARAAADVPSGLRARYLRSQGPEVVVADELRDLVTFARHDLMGTTLAPVEAVVASFQVIVLRNVLLYFDPRLRQKTFERLAAVIKPGGALVLGGFESIPEEAASKFHPYPGLPETLRIFQSSGD
jgi:two-component system CheB/CheR fusion protein